jgi:hypothetical protein
MKRDGRHRSLMVETPEKGNHGMSKAQDHARLGQQVRLQVYTHSLWDALGVAAMLEEHACGDCRRVLW